jgi:hypothetical protein
MCQVQRKALKRRPFLIQKASNECRLDVYLSAESLFKYLELNQKTSRILTNRGRKSGVMQRILSIFLTTLFYKGESKLGRFTAGKKFQTCSK